MAGASLRQDRVESWELGTGGSSFQPETLPVKKNESVAEATALGMIKERVVAWRGGRAVTSRRTTNLLVDRGDADCWELGKSNSGTSIGSGGSSRRGSTPLSTPQRVLPTGLQSPASYSQATFKKSSKQPTSSKLREWGSVSDTTLRTLERDRRLDTWLKRHGLSLPLVKVAVQTAIAMLGICLWMTVPLIYGVTLDEWSSPSWAGITVILLLEPTAGATLAKTVLRVGGTVVGACFSSWLLEALRFALPAVDATLVCCTLPPFCALCAYCKARYKPYAYFWTVCSLTPTIVVLFSFTEPEEQRWYFAVYRCLNVVLGALLVLAIAKIPPLAVCAPHAPPAPYAPPAPPAPPASPAPPPP